MKSTLDSTYAWYLQISKKLCVMSQLLDNFIILFIILYILFYVLKKLLYTVIAILIGLLIKKRYFFFKK